MIWESISGFQEGDGARLPRVTQILPPVEASDYSKLCEWLYEDEVMAGEGCLCPEPDRLTGQIEEETLQTRRTTRQRSCTAQQVCPDVGRPA